MVRWLKMIFMLPWAPSKKDLEGFLDSASRGIRKRYDEADADFKARLLLELKKETT